MNRTKFLVILAIVAVASAVLIVSALRFKQTGASTRALPSASEADTRLPGRRFHIINLSLIRTGTTSIAGLFDRFRSAHEYMLLETLTHVQDWREGRISGEVLDSFLLEREKRSRLELDSTTALVLAQDRVFSLFPDAKFLLSVRNGTNWVVSALDLMFFMYQTCAEQEMLHDLACSELIPQSNRLWTSITPQFKEEHFRDIEDVRRNIGPILPDLAAFWGNSTLTTLEKLSQLPTDRVLIIRTENIDSSLDKLAAFAGIDKSELNLEKHHVNRGRKTHDFAKLIGKDKIADAFQPWQVKVDARLKEMGIE